MSYVAIKHLHILCVVLSGTGFLFRGILMLRGSLWLNNRWIRVLPHIVDTLLLASALTLVWLSGQYPFVQSWLTAKVIALVVYVVLGALALRRAKTRQARIICFGLALLTFVYMVLVARTKLPMIFF